MKGVAYVRYSSETQSDISLEAQTGEIRSYAEKKGIQIIKVYSDPGRSAGDDNRPAFQELFTDIKHRKYPDVECAVVHAIDRWSRNLYQAAFYRAELKRYGITLLSTKEDIEGPNGDLIFNIMASVADHYRNNLVLEVKTKNRYVARHGFFLGGKPPFGLKLQEVEDEQGKIRKVYAIDEETAPLVRRIFEMAADGHSLQKIAEYMNTTGLLTARGNAWTARQIYEMLRNERYAGTYVYGNGTKKNYHANKDDAIRIKNAIEPIITRELYDAARKKTGVQQRVNTRRYYYLLKGIAVCWCGAPLTVGSGGDYPRYCCSKAKGQNLKGHVSMGKDKLERHIWKSIEHIWLGRTDFETLAAKFNEEVCKLQDDTGEKIDAIQELNSIRKQIDNAVKAILAGSQLSAELERKITELKKRKGEIEDVLRGTAPSKELLTAYQLQELWSNLKEMEKEDVVKALTKRITVTRDRYIDVEWKFKI